MNHRVDHPGFADALDASAQPAPTADIEAVEVGTALVSDAAAIDELEVTGARPVPTLATSALVRAGSGVLGSTEAETLRTAVAKAYDAAVKAGAPEQVDLGADALRSYLAPADAERIDLQLDLLWLAAGGDLADRDNSDRLLHPNCLAMSGRSCLTSFSREPSLQTDPCGTSWLPTEPRGRGGSAQQG